MTTLTWLTNAVVRDGKDELDGKVLTRPALLVTDGENVVYGVDVDIGIVDTTGYDETQDLINAAIVGSVLRNVPIARGNDALTYADVGSAVRLRRTASGRYEVVGFARQMPGTHVRIPVDVGTLTFDAVEDLTMTSRALTFAELADFGGGFGIVPLGTYAVYRGTTLIDLRA